MPTKAKRSWYVGRDRRQLFHKSVGSRGFGRRPRRPEPDAEALSEVVEGIRRLERAARVLAVSDDQRARAVTRECRRLAMSLRVLDRRVAEAISPQPVEGAVADRWKTASRQYRKAAIHLGRAENLFLRQSTAPQARRLAAAIGEVVRHIKGLPDGNPWKNPA